MRVKCKCSYPIGIGSDLPSWTSGIPRGLSMEKCNFMEGLLSFTSVINLGFTTTASEPARLLALMLSSPLGMAAMVWALLNSASVTV